MKFVERNLKAHCLEKVHPIVSEVKTTESNPLKNADWAVASVSVDTQQDASNMPNVDGVGLKGSNESNKGDGEPEDDSDSDVDREGSGWFVPPPTVEDAKSAYADIKEILKPKQNKGPGHKDLELDLLLRCRLEKMKLFLWAYINSTRRGAWVAASLKTAKDVDEGPWSAQMLWRWVHAFIIDRANLPINLYGKWNTSKTPA
jgi:hypothetical protein